MVATHLPRSRWLALAAALLIESVAGIVYAFSLYSDTLQSHFNLTQHETDLLGTVANWGGNFGVHIGYFYAFFGPQATVLLAGVLGVPSWLLMWLALSAGEGSAEWMPYGGLVVVSFLQGHSQMILDCAAVPVVIDYFPEHRGRAVGLTKALVGLSGSLVAIIYQSAFSPKVVPFLLFLAIELGAVCLVGATFLRPPDKDTPTSRDPRLPLPRQRLTMCTGLEATVTTLVVVGALLGSSRHAASLAIAATVYVVFYGGLLRMSFWRELALPELESPAPQGRHAELEAPPAAPLLSPLLTAPEPPPESSADAWLATPPLRALQADAKPIAEEVEGAGGGAFVDRSLTDALCLAEAWLLFAIMWLGCGAGLMVINNLTKIHAAKVGASAVGSDGALVAPSELVSLISAFNCAGRLGAGWLSDAALRRLRMPRPLAMGAALLLEVGALLLLLLDSSWLLYVACPLVGIAYGALNALQPAIASEVFGTTYLPQIYPFLSISLAAGSYTFATFLFATVYERGKSSHGLSHGESCFYADCFALSYVVSAGACLTGAVFAVYLARRTRRRYRVLSVGSG